MIDIQKKTKKEGIFALSLLAILMLVITLFSGCTQTNNENQGLPIVVVGRDSASGTREFFWEHVMKKGNFTTTMLEKNSNGAVHQTVSTTQGAIGYVGLGYLDEEVKAVKINGIEATVANVVAGTYPISRALNMYTNGEPTGIALEFLKYLDSTEGQAIVEDEGFVPKTSTGSYVKVDGLLGSITIVGSTTVLPIAQLAAEDFNTLYGENLVAVSGGGSSVGVQSVGEGSAIIGMASRELKSSETTSYPNLVKHIVCNDGIAIIINPENTYVEDLTLEQVQDIYDGTYTNWDELE
ncbi:MAG: substrate-binding domain-containing protein [Candidatus Thermoplasmatota archaeon]|nr:substrate-binding domain-containing protein [Candidatus Thermoplasmatota archaeon]